MTVIKEEAEPILAYRFIFHILILALLVFGPLLLLPDGIGAQRKPVMEHFIFRWTVNGLMIAPFYFINVYYYIPRLLKPGKYGWYVAILVLSCALAVLVFNGINQFAPSSELAMRRIPGDTMTPPGRIILFPMILFPMIMSLAVGTSFEMVINWEIQRKERAQIEREKMSAELSFLKSQMNPHFLFNSLNSIYALAEQRSGKAGEAVLMLSNLMRYMLYGSNNGKLQLSKEIECIENYIAIQKLRISSREEVIIQLRINGSSLDALIEPLILLPFIENAFKHGVSYHHRSEVLIDLTTEAHRIDLHVRNTKKLIPTKSTPGTDSGIGLNNIKRRLDLLYAGRHDLSILNTKDHFEVRLHIII